jgi:hypothetical protein
MKPSEGEMDRRLSSNKVNKSLNMKQNTNTSQKLTTSSAKKGFLKLFILQMIACAPGYASVVVPGLYNTGVDNTGAALPVQSHELHFTLSGVASIAYVVPRHPAWVAAPNGSAWIGPNGTTSPFVYDPVGTYDYKLNFDLSGFDPSQIRISGAWATDDTGAQIFLNGQNTGLISSGYSALASFNLQSGFIPGINTLDFRVANGSPQGTDNPTGLLVGNLNVTVVPEPSLAGILCLGACACLFFKSRTSRSLLRQS